MRGGKRKGAGRPKSARGSRFELYLDANLASLVLTAAEKAGQTVQQFIRAMLANRYL